MTAISTTGRCLCGAVRYEFAPDAVLRQDFCHCESCRRATASPVTAFVMVREDDFRWTAEAPRTYPSSAGVTRGFCATCGTSMSYQNVEQPGEMHLYSATLDGPETASPEAHAFWSERLPWLHVTDDLPKED